MKPNPNHKFKKTPLSLFPPTHQYLHKQNDPYRGSHIVNGGQRPPNDQTNISFSHPAMQNQTYLKMNEDQKQDPSLNNKEISYPQTTAYATLLIHFLNFLIVILLYFFAYRFHRVG